MQRLSKGRHLQRLASTENVFTLLCLAVVLPLVALSAYIHPQDYDFSWAVFLRENGFWGTYQLAYLTQGGRYVANFLALLTPIPLDPTLRPITDEALLLYRLAPSAVMLAIILSAYLFLGAIYEGIRIRDRWTMVFGITLAYLGTLEDHAEVLYWFNGNMQYLVPLATLLLFLTYLARMATEEGRRNLLLAGLWGAVTVGCNETVLLAVNLLLLAVCTRLFIASDPRRRDFLTLFGAILACSLVAVLAPGNGARDGMTEFAREKDLVLAVYKSLNRSLANTLHWVPVTAVMSLLLTEFIQRKGIRLKPALRDIDLRWATPLVPACVIAAYFPNAWARGGANPALRIVDDAQFLFMAGALLLLFLLADRHTADRGSHWMPAPGPARWVLLAALVCILHSNGRVKRAYTDLLRNAPTYDREMTSRYQTIGKNLTADTLVLPPLSRIPATVFFRDIRTDPRWWLNGAETRFFKSGILRLSDENPVFRNTPDR